MPRARPPLATLAPSGCPRRRPQPLAGRGDPRTDRPTGLTRGPDAPVSPRATPRPWQGLQRASPPARDPRKGRRGKRRETGKARPEAQGLALPPPPRGPNTGCLHPSWTRGSPRRRGCRGIWPVRAQPGASKHTHMLLCIYKHATYMCTHICTCIYVCIYIMCIMHIYLHACMYILTKAKSSSQRAPG